MLTGGGEGVGEKAAARFETYFIFYVFQTHGVFTPVAESLRPIDILVATSLYTKKISSIMCTYSKLSNVFYRVYIRFFRE